MNVWHPFTQHALSGPALEIERAEGVYLYTKDGRKIIDAISSWWVNTHGHCHPKIVAAVQAQAAKLEQVIFAGFTHDPAEQLAKKLLKLTGFQHVFYSDSGSTAVEVALKMALGYWNHITPIEKNWLGGPKPRKLKNIIVTIEHAYHGDTFGGMSLGDHDEFFVAYEEFFFDTYRINFPFSGYEDETFDQLQALLESSKVAAVVLEPLVLGAAGMMMYKEETLKRIHDLCKAHDALLIADEVMTGFGRTGAMFACEKAGFMPDIMCLSKGLTGGFLPMGATLCTSRIYDAFYQKDRSKMFFHSSSYTGNALACAAALASLKIWEEEPVTQRIAAISASHEKAIQRFAARDDVVNARSCGTIFAFEVKAERYEYFSNIGPKLYEIFMENDVLLRPLGNTVYILPPYCITEEELNHVYDVIDIALDRLRDDGEQQAA